MPNAMMVAGRLRVVHGGSLLSVGHNAAYQTEEEAENVLRLNAQTVGGRVGAAAGGAAAAAPMGATYGLMSRQLPDGAAGSVAAAYGVRPDAITPRAVGHTIRGDGISSLTEKLRNLEVKRGAAGHRGVKFA